MQYNKNFRTYTSIDMLDKFLVELGNEFLVSQLETSTPSTKGISTPLTPDEEKELSSLGVIITPEVIERYRASTASLEASETISPFFSMRVRGNLITCWISYKEAGKIQGKIQPEHLAIKDTSLPKGEKLEIPGEYKIYLLDSKDPLKSVLHAQRKDFTSQVMSCESFYKRDFSAPDVTGSIFSSKGSPKRKNAWGAISCRDCAYRPSNKDIQVGSPEYMNKCRVHDIKLCILNGNINGTVQSILCFWDVSGMFDNNFHNILGTRKENAYQNIYTISKFSSSKDKKIGRKFELLKKEPFQVINGSALYKAVGRVKSTFYTAYETFMAPVKEEPSPTTTQQVKEVCTDENLADI